MFLKTRFYEPKLYLNLKNDLSSVFNTKKYNYYQIFLKCKEASKKFLLFLFTKVSDDEKFEIMGRIGSIELWKKYESEDGLDDLLENAVIYDNIELVIYILEKYIISSTGRDKKDFLSIFLSIERAVCRKGDMKTLALCEKYRGDEERDYEDKVICAGEAVVGNHMSLLQYFMIDIKVETEILSSACTSGNFKLIEYLLSKGGRKDSLVLFLAIGGHLDLVKHYISKGYNYENCVNSCSSLNLIKYFIEEKKQVVSEDILEYTPSIDVLRYLVENRHITHVYEDILSCYRNEGSYEEDYLRENCEISEEEGEQTDDEEYY